MSIRLEFPYDTPTQILILPNPSPSDMLTTDFGLIWGFDEDSNIYTYLKTPFNQSIEYVFTALTDLQAQALEDFIVNNIGPMRLIDPQNKEWRVICLTNSLPFTKARFLESIRLEFDAVPITPLPAWVWTDVT